MDGAVPPNIKSFQFISSLGACGFKASASIFKIDCRRSSESLVIVEDSRSASFGSRVYDVFPWTTLLRMEYASLINLKISIC